MTRPGDCLVDVCQLAKRSAVPMNPAIEACSPEPRKGKDEQMDEDDEPEQHDWFPRLGSAKSTRNAEPGSVCRKGYRGVPGKLTWPASPDALTGRKFAFARIC